ncbi:MAG TPA: serine/threonine-protein kinase [Polyangia bacterium]
MVGRYVMYGEIASGGMASVHLGRLCAAVGFSRTVAIKYLHPHFARDSEFISMFLDEARLVSRIQHPNVATPLDVVLLEESEELFLVMEYIHGQSLARLLKSAHAMKVIVPAAISAGIMSGALHGLHAAHEAADELGAPLNIVHRDVSPHNIMVGVDGVPKVLDFGVAKAVSRIQSTQQGQVKGKVSYMAPEQLQSALVDRRADIFAAGIVFWEALTLQRLFESDNPAAAISKVLTTPIPAPSTKNPNVSPALDSVTLKALHRDVNQRFQTAREFAEAIEEAIRVSTARKVGEWVVYLGGADLADNSKRLAAVESSSLDGNLAGAQRLPNQQMAYSAKSVVKRPDTYSNIDAISTAILHAKDMTPVPAVESTALVPRSRLFFRWLSSRRRHGPILAGVVALVFALAVVGIVRLPLEKNAKSTEKTSAAVPTGRAIPASVASVSMASHEPPDLPKPDQVTVTAIPVESKGLARTRPRKTSPQGSASASVTTRKDTKKHDCTPPFYIDGQGIRRVKTECL